MTTTSRGRKLAEDYQMIRTVGFLQKLSTTDDVTKYRGISVSRYFLRRYIIVGHFLIPHILTWTPIFAGYDMSTYYIGKVELLWNCQFQPNVLSGAKSNSQ